MADAARRVISQELSSDEKLLWSGQPPSGVRVHPADAFFIPFSILWCGFAIFWEVSVLKEARHMGGIPLFFVLWGVPFVLVGLYVVFGRFYSDALLRSRTFYGVTLERIIIVSGLFSRQIQSLDLPTLTDLMLKEGRNGGGTIMFGKPHPFSGFYPGTAWPGMNTMATPSFEVEKHAREVYNLIRRAQREAYRNPEAANGEANELDARTIGSGAAGESGRAAAGPNLLWSWSPFAVRHLRLATRLTPQQCYERLQPKVKPASSSPRSLSAGQVWGEVSADGFQIHRDARDLVHGFQVEAHGTFRPTLSGTQIDVRPTADPSSFAFMVVWLTGVSLFLCGGIAQFLVPHKRGWHPQWAFVLIPAAMLLFGCAFFRIFRRALEDRLLEFLQKTLQAKETSQA